MSKWQLVTSFFNSKKSNKIFTRAEYFSNVSRILKAHDYLVNHSCLDSYRCYLQEAGYLKQEEPGVYRKVRFIPLNLTSTKCRKEAYNK